MAVLGMSRPPTPLVLAFVVLLNLAPLAGVLWFGWRADILLLLYWAENVVVGVFTLARILSSGFSHGVPEGLASIALAAFFTFHYGLFCLGHLFFLTLVIGGLSAGGTLNPMWPPLGQLQSGWAVWSLAALTLMHLLSFAEWWLRGSPRATTPKEEMGRPYVRIIVLHITILAGAALVIRFGQPIWTLVMLVALKTLMEVIGVIQDRRRAARQAQAAADANAPSLV